MSANWARLWARLDRSNRDGLVHAIPQYCNRLGEACLNIDQMSGLLYEGEFGDMTLSQSPPHWASELQGKLGWFKRPQYRSPVNASREYSQAWGGLCR
jgi:hypothetical protein